jgi:sec-independent protein translocase protein TatB
MFLDPAKLLVVLIVALIVLGPDKLPSVARQAGAAWGELRRFRQRLESEVRGSFPDLPSTEQVAQAVRSPLAFLDQLADAHEREQNKADEQSQPDLAFKPTLPAPAHDSNGSDALADEKGADEKGAEEKSEESPAVPLGRPPAGRPIGRTRPWRAGATAEAATIPDDPSLN